MARRTLWGAAVAVLAGSFVADGWCQESDGSFGEAFSCDDPGTQASYLYLSKDGWPSCDVSLSLPVETIRVVLSSTPATAVRISIPDPPFGSIIDESWLFPHMGDRIQGLELDLGDGTPPGMTLGTLTILPTDIVNACHAWTIGSGEIDYRNGETGVPFIWSHTFFGTARGDCTPCECWQCCVLLPARQLSPPDGALDVPPNVVLSWSGVDIGRLDISTDPNCDNPRTFVFESANSFSPDFLEPNTTYHWWLSFDATGSGCNNAAGIFRSPVASFTTGPVAVERRSWSNLKLLYGAHRED